MDKMVILVGRYIAFRASFATALPSKSVSGYSTLFIKGVIESIAHRRCVFRSDIEPALLDVLRAGVQASPMVGVVFKSSGVADAAENGGAERAVGKIKSSMRTVLHELRHNYGNDIRGWPHSLSVAAPAGRQCS